MHKKLYAENFFYKGRAPLKFFTVWIRGESKINPDFAERLKRPSIVRRVAKKINFFNKIFQYIKNK